MSTERSSTVIAICGAGTMGQGIAMAAMSSGYSVLLYDVAQGSLDKARSFIESMYAKSVERGRLSPERASQEIGLLRFTESVSEIATAQWVIEAIIENLEIKNTLFRTILTEGLAESSVIATNTSSLSVSRLASALPSHKDRFVGLHFFNPANLMQLVEVVPTSFTTEPVLQASVEFIRSLKKVPVVAKDVPGFIVNRVARNYYNEAMRCATEQIADLKTIDTVMKSYGFKMGPFELMDLIGNDVNLEVTKSVYAQYFNESRFAPSSLQQMTVDAGLFGRKTGRGFHDYSSGKS